jgi:hypothetical protein
MNEISMQATPYNVRSNSPKHLLQLCPCIKAVRGYLYGRAFVTLENVSDKRQMAALITDLRKHDPTITPVGFGDIKAVGGHRFAARCPQCSVICSNFFIMAEFFEDVAQCRLANCSCDYPNFEGSWF